MTDDAGDEDEPTIPVVCETCGTTTDVQLSEAAAAIRRHNEQLHDGEECAQVDPAIAERIQDLVARDLGLLD